MLYIIPNGYCNCGLRLIKRTDDEMVGLNVFVTYCVLLVSVTESSYNPDVESLQEVAEGKTSTQSTQHSSYKPGNANDGNLNTFSHTTDEQSPYWEVDLGRNYKIRQIEIFARRDCCGDLIRKLDITAGPSHNLMTRCGFYSGPAKTRDHLVFECRPIINGRYVRIQKNDSTNLALAEVQVMAIVDKTVG
ncbi:fucolectin-1-like [Mytilus trossulus]|uniref:fucolectin-1-like n=1 Tax=Mytilus trossulus TaxID=6551 RepID=UPI00300540DE